MSIETCRQCGCCDNDPCIVLEGKRLTDAELEAMSDDDIDRAPLSNCSWVQPGLCSACVQGTVPPLLVDQNGRPLRGAP